MSNIPGLILCPVDDVSGEGFEIPSFSETIFIPESHRLGNCRSVNDFEKISVISEGTFGVLYKCRDKKTSEVYALKKFKMLTDLHDGIPSSILREINILNTLKHANLVNSHGTVAGKNLENNFLILDYCECSLKELIERNVEAIYNKAMVKFLMKQLLFGLEYIHGGLIIHRDICSKNLVFSGQGILKIGGFRASRFYSKGNMTPGVTELDYRAPELLFQAKLYGPAVDMWSAGCIFAQLLLKNRLFNGSSELEVLKSIFRVLGTPSETIWPGFSELFHQMETGGTLLEFEDEQPYSDLKNSFDTETAACKDLIQDLLVYFPNARLSAQECLKCYYFTESPHASKCEDLALILRNRIHDAGPSGVYN